MSKKKIFLAIPTTGTICDGIPYILRDIQEKYGDKVELVWPKECVRRMFHDFARNSLVDEFLASDCDVMWFLDSDVLPQSRCIEYVTERWDEWKIAACPYPVFMTPKYLEGGGPQAIFVVYQDMGNGHITEADCPESGIAEVAGAATGCLFIKREVLERMQKPYFSFEYDPITRDLKKGEDIYFCYKAKELGYKFYVDFSFVCNHFKNVGLLYVNNYAMDYARNTMAAFEESMKHQLLQKKLQEKAKSSIVMPDKKLILA